MSRDDPNELVEVDVEFLEEVGNSLKVETPKGRVVFLPKARSDVEPGPAGTFGVLVERWLAEKEDLL